ncbi:acid phosphatase type 7 isoform X1 [Electrophorus electricus]|uniref:acid phosphatase type 7 isoform X1 n=1 Tax=Electrophorus electricus TaxID=8005 RepID=UPI0015CFCB96|nr:acid phosphatase type 7 isoform X1 [Electrophorus electricus]XP_035388914.1 acid phosphatase type 7 isoform X1 [Electrophorus electricus]XP_035388915.1 acid phosphatase type 7 isoform X1 [Electrophorus electricus]XP_035388916.1 acid phosphatase type 7 isoform X1 [Electrophorus electricus]
MVALYVLLFGQICVASCVLPIGSQPEQVHLSYPGVKGSMVITWTTLNATESIVEYGLWGGKLFTQSARGNCTTFVDGGSEKRKIYIHRVTLSELIPGFTYVYHCGSEAGWSDVLYFTALIESTSFSPKFALFGDMGNENPQSLARLQKETQVGMYDVILHIVLYSFFVHVNGLQSDKAQVTKPKIHISEYLQRDFAYDMHEDEGRIGDEFMKQIESIAAYVPYMTCPGNHEWAYNFSHYRSRFNMPGQTEGLWYSWNIGSAHIISFSTEVYFYLEYGLDLLFRQYEWLKGDLEEANKPENRAARPWIITMAHRPMYCSNNDHDDCTKFESYVRLGRNDTDPPAPGLEDLFYRQGVDLEFWAHEHTYERLWPVYNYKVFNGSTEEPYMNPRAPVHIITGSAGCREKHDGFIPKPREWSAFRSTDYGYTRMHLINSTHIYLEQVSDDQSGKVIDSLLLIKDVHGPEAWL